MIYCLTGKILKKSLDSVVISCAGVGYYVQVPATTGEALPAPGQEGTVYTIMNVTENDVSLYGFANEEQRDCFKMLTAVTGVGPKAGLSILSIMSPEKVALAASSGDYKAFTKASGPGAGCGGAGQPGLYPQRCRRRGGPRGRDTARTGYYQGGAAQPVPRTLKGVNNESGIYGRPRPPCQPGRHARRCRGDQPASQNVG